MLVQGDTTTAAAAAQAAFFRRVRVAHVEAGLRTGDLASPFPEEFNRRVVTLAASLHCAPTEQAAANLRAEGVDPVHVRSLGVTDNTAVGRLDPSGLPPIAREIPSDIDALVLSACVQMPSLPVLAAVEQELGIPVLSAATATVFQSLRRLGQPTTVPGGGHLLSGAFDALTGAGKEQ